MKNNNKFVFIKQKIENIDKYSIGIVKEILENSILVDIVSQNKCYSLPIEIIEFFNPEETGDAFDKKVCNICHKILDISNFEKNQNAKNNRSVRRPSCKICRLDINGKSISSKDKKDFLNKKPIYEKFTCPICQKTTIPNLTSKVVLDHDHQKGNIRGWLCDSCNTGLGRFKDSPELLQNAIRYLQGK